MSIEKRYHQRHPCHIAAQLIYHGRSFSVTATDLSAHGMSLKVDYLTIPQGNIVELELVLGGGRWLINGLITHVGERRMGIMFRMRQPELLKALQASDSQQNLAPPRPLPARYGGAHSTR